MPVSGLDVLGALDNGASLLALIGFMVSKVREVHRFHKDCQELTSTCITLSLTFLDHKEALQDTRLREDFGKCLQDMYFLIMECREWNILHVTFDVAMKHRVTGLKARLDELQKLFGFEILMTLKGASSGTTDALRSLISQMSEMKEAQDVGVQDNKQILESIQQLRDDVLKARREKLSLLPLPPANLENISISTPTLHVSESSSHGNPLRGTFNGNPVTFQEIINKGGVSDGLPRVVKLYKEMADVAQIQTLYGIVEKEGRLYAIMEDMTVRYTSLSDAVATGMTTKLSRLQKLKIAYEIAATLSALHRSGILVKVLSDVTVHYEQLPDGGMRAKISELDHARRIWETSTHTDEDARFEAPETEMVGSKSTMSDIWGLGIILHILLLAEMPYGQPSSINNKDGQAKIRLLLHSGSAPFTSYSTPLTKELELAQECLRSDPFLRPTAPWLAEQLFSVLIQVGANHMIHIPQPPVSITISQPITDLAKKASIEYLVKEILQAAAAAHKAKTKKDREGIKKFSKEQVAPLVEVAESSPVYAFAVGLVYIRNIVETDEEPWELVPREVRCAKLAVPWLEMAEQQGHVGAIKELVRAYKILGEHYYSQLKMEPE